MKAYIYSLVKQWEPIKYGPKHPFYNLRWVIKNALRIINEEVIVGINNLRFSIYLVFALTFLVSLSIFLSVFLGGKELRILLMGVATVTLAFLAVFITVAVFSATMSAQSRLRAADVSAEYAKHLFSEPRIFEVIYSKIAEEMNEDQKLKLIIANAADSISDQPSYISFLTWTHTINKDFSSGHVKDLKIYPYDLATSATQNRAWPIREALLMLRYDFDEPVLKGYKISDEELRKLDKLRKATSSYEASGVPGYFESQQFLGPRLTRVTIYALSAIVVSTIYNSIQPLQVSGVSETIIPEAIKALMIMIVLGGFFLSVRYLVLFTGYLRNLHIYDPMNLPSFYYTDPNETRFRY